MMTPGFTAEASLYRGTTHFAMRADGGPGTGSAVLAQICGSTGCRTVGGGRVCFNIPYIGRKCFTLPSGRFQIRCCTRWGWPPVSCSISSC